MEQQTGSGTEVESAHVGPLAKQVSDLFQGIIKDGVHPKYSMCYKDHGSGWKYVFSDHRRVNPTEAAFNWRYDWLENRILDCLVDLDWSGLNVEKDIEVRALTDELAIAEGNLPSLDKEARHLVQLVRAAGHIKETAAELNEVEKKRGSLIIRVVHPCGVEPQTF